jgi:hypothetical protein
LLLNHLLGRLHHVVVPERVLGLRLAACHSGLLRGAVVLRLSGDCAYVH